MPKATTRSRALSYTSAESAEGAVPDVVCCERCTHWLPFQTQTSLKLDPLNSNGCPSPPSYSIDPDEIGPVLVAAFVQPDPSHCHVETALAELASITTV